MTVDELLQAYYEALKMRQTADREILKITQELGTRDDVADTDLMDIAEAYDEADLALDADVWMIRDCTRIIWERENAKNDG